MNNLIQIREKIKKARRLYQSQLLATRNGQFTPYRNSVFEQRVREARRDMELQDS